MNDEHQHLRQLLHDAVDDVEPPSGLDEIQRRTRTGAARGSRRRWAPLVAAVAAVVVVITGGTAVVAHQLQDGSRHRPAPAASVSASPAPTRDTDVTVYYVSETASGPRLFSERHHLTGVTGSDLEAAVRDAANDPPLDSDYYPFPGTNGVTVVATKGNDEITIDLERWAQPDPQDAGSGEDQQLTLQALVWTADAATGTQLPVRFLVDGKPTDVVLSTDTSRPVAPLSADSALATVSISQPAEGAVVGRTFTVRGQAAAVEANVVWELKQGGRVVKQGDTTASQCCTLSPYSFNVTAPPGRYDLVVHDTDESDGEGIGTSEDTKTVVVK